MLSAGFKSHPWSNHVARDKVTFAAISNSIRLQSDSIPFAVSLSRQPCNMMLPVAFALKTILARDVSMGTKFKNEG